jgi:hypothetical protein
MDLVRLKGTPVVLLAFMLVWSSAYCAALCAGEPAGGNDSSELACHHHDPGKRPSCSDQQFPQFDVPRTLSNQTAHPSIDAVNSGVGSLMQPSSLCATLGSLMLHTLWPPGFALHPVVVLRI